MLSPAVLPVDVTSPSVRQYSPRPQSQENTGSSFRSNMEQQVAQQRNDRQETIERAGAKKVGQLDKDKDKHNDESTVVNSSTMPSVQPALQDETKTAEISKKDSLKDDALPVDEITNTAIDSVSVISAKEKVETTPDATVSGNVLPDTAMLATATLAVNEQTPDVALNATAIHKGLDGMPAQGFEISWFKGGDQRLSVTELASAKLTKDTASLNVNQMPPNKQAIGSDKSVADQYIDYAALQNKAALPVDDAQNTRDTSDKLASVSTFTSLLLANTGLKAMVPGATSDKPMVDGKAVSGNAIASLVDPSMVVSELKNMIRPTDANVKSQESFNLGESASTAGQVSVSAQPETSSRIINNAAQPPALTPNAGLSADFANRLNDQVMWLRHQNINVAELRLHPRDLGSILVRIDNSGDNTNVNFVAAHHTVRDVLDQNMIKLRELFNDAGLNLVNVHVSSGSEEQRRDLSSSGGSPQFSQTYQDGKEQEPDGAVSEEGVMATTSSIHLVDFFA